MLCTKPATLLKVTLLHGCFSRFLNWTNVSKLHRASHFDKSCSGNINYEHCLDSALNSKQQKKKKSRGSLARVSLGNVNYRYNLWILFALNSAWIHLLEAKRKKAKEKELS